MSKFIVKQINLSLADWNDFIIEFCINPINLILYGILSLTVSDKVEHIYFLILYFFFIYGTLSSGYKGLGGKQLFIPLRNSNFNINSWIPKCIEISILRIPGISFSDVVLKSFLAKLFSIASVRISNKVFMSDKLFYCRTNNTYTGQAVSMS